MIGTCLDRCRKAHCIKFHCDNYFIYYTISALKLELQFSVFSRITTRLAVDITNLSVCLSPKCALAGHVPESLYNFRSYTVPQKKCLHFLQ